MNFNAIISVILNSTEIQSIFRILLAICFGALIGLEREHAHRPAGLRTHILVCLGSCLVMLTSEYIYNRYHQKFKRRFRRTFARRQNRFSRRNKR